MTFVVQDKICLWNSRTGEYLNTITIPPHYNCRVSLTKYYNVPHLQYNDVITVIKNNFLLQDDPVETTDKYCWKGHTDFAFTEDGIIIIHSQRNFPIAADVLLFW